MSFSSSSSAADYDDDALNQFSATIRPRQESQRFLNSIRIREVKDN